MRRMFMLASLPLMVWSSLALAGPVQVESPVNKVFVPLGFDDNDDAEVVLRGDFTNSCYKVGPATATVNAETRTVTIDAKSWYYQGASCAQMLVPFIQPVKLGIVPTGEYKIVVNGQDRIDATALQVTRATSRSADDYLYAPVAQVEVKKDDAGRKQLSLSGEYPYMFVGCMKIVEVRAKVTPGNVLVVQPIAETFMDDADCQGQEVSKAFKITQEADSLVEDAEYLAHVRALSGQSVNRLINLK